MFHFFGRSIRAYCLVVKASRNLMGEMGSIPYGTESPWCPYVQGWQGRWGARGAGRQKAAPPAGARGAAKFRGR